MLRGTLLVAVLGRQRRRAVVPVLWGSLLVAGLWRGALLAVLWGTLLVARQRWWAVVPVLWGQWRLLVSVVGGQRRRAARGAHAFACGVAPGSGGGPVGVNSAATAGTVCAAAQPGMPFVHTSVAGVT